jgi:AcrR family transcriptional regulator
MTRPKLTRQRVALVSLELIDEVGIEKFSMRKLGLRMGVDPMAAYRHFRNQEDLFDAVAEQLFTETKPETLPWDHGWRTLAEEYCLRLRDALLKHPRAVTVFATRPVRSQASIDTGVRMIETFVAEGFTSADSLRIARALRELTIGHALSLAMVQLGSQARSGKPKPGSPKYNMLAYAADSTGIDDHFEVSVAAMLEGFERLLDRQNAS